MHTKSHALASNDSIVQFTRFPSVFASETLAGIQAQLISKLISYLARQSRVLCNRIDRRVQCHNRHTKQCSDYAVLQSLLVWCSCSAMSHEISDNNSNLMT